MKESLRQSPIHGWDLKSLINLAANYAGRLWSMLAAFIFVPFYIKILGAESYGLIAFNVTLTLVVSVLSAGLIPAFARLMARDGISNSTLHTLRSLELTLIAVGLVVAFVTYMISPLIAVSWLSVSELDINTVISSIRLMGFISAVEMLMPLYIGGFMGLQQQVKANFYQFLLGFFRSVLVMPVLYYYPSIVVFFGWFLLMTVVVVWSVRISFYRKFSGFGAARFSLPHLKVVWSFAAGMAVIGFLSAVNSQIDKLMVSALFDLKVFAQYSLASILAQLPLIVSTPIAMTILPGLTKAVKSSENLDRLFSSYSLFVCLAACSVSVVTIIFPTEILSLWTRDQSLSFGQETLVRILVLANLALALQLIPFQIAIAHAFTRINVILSIICVLAVPPGIILFATQFGISGVAAPWLLINIFSAVVLNLVISSKYLETPLKKLIKFVIVPLTICGFIAWKV